MAGQNDFLELTFANKENTLSVRRFLVHEELSRLFEVAIIARSPKPDIDLEAIVGKNASFKINTGLVNAMVARLWTGVCSYIEQVQVEVTPVGLPLSTYYIRIVPDMWLLTQRTNHRIFQRKTLPEIVQAILGEWKIKPNLKLNRTYVQHDYVVQYGETDYAFVCRLLERAGITFSFTFDEDKVTELTLADEPEHGPERGKAISNVDNPNPEAELEYVTRVHVSQSVRPGKFTIREFDFRQKPDFPFFSKGKPADAPEDFYEQYHYWPGDSLRVDPPDGAGGGTPTADDHGKVRNSQKELDGRAERELDGLRRSRGEVTFKTNCVDITPGLRFSIDKHVRSDLKPSEQLLCSEFSLEGVVGEKWSFGGRASFAKQPWRPAMTTPRPTIPGVQSAIVVGPSGQDIWTDEFGRVRVQFHWDRDGKYDEESSAWIRVSQQWAGAGYGSELIPRVGHEVLVGFLEGDPDQPLVVGRVYGIMNRVPHKLPDNKTRSTWKSSSSPYSNGFSEIMFEDKLDNELFYVQAELDLQKLTKREETERTYENRKSVVGANRSAVIKTVDATLVGESYTVQMISPPSEYDLKIQRQEFPVVKPTKTTTEMRDKRIIFTTGNATLAFDGSNIAFEAAGKITIKAHGGDAIFDGSHAWINTMSPSGAPKPAAIDKMQPGTFVSNKGDKREVLNKFQAARAALRYAALSAVDKARFDKLMKDAKSDKERAYLQKALAAGHPLDKIEPFAARINGQSSEWMQNNLALTGDTTGRGVQQQWHDSCNVTSVQATKGELDPLYALQVHDANPDPSKVDDHNAMAVNPALATEQRTMLQTPYTGGLGNMGGGVAVNRDQGGGAGRWADDHLNAAKSTTGVQYQTIKSPGAANGMATIDAGLEQGAPVPIVVGNGPNSYGHYVVVTGALDGPPKSYVVHDPWTGNTQQVAATDMANGTMNVAGWNQLTAVDRPTILP